MFESRGKKGRRGNRGALPGIEVLEDRALLSASPLFDVNHTSDSSLPPGMPDGNVAILGNHAYFAADGDQGTGLYRTDGSGRGTTLVKAFDTPEDVGLGLTHLTAANGLLYFTVSDGTHGDEVWVSDGTAAGTRLLKDIHEGPGAFPGENGSSACDFTAVGSLVLFTSNDGSNGSELWVTNGTSEGTRLVKDVNPNNNAWEYGGDGPTQLTAYKGKLYFMADDGSHGRELWVSDGTAAGTRLVKDINRGAASSTYPSPIIYYDTFLPFEEPAMVVVGDSLFFAADDGKNGVELWKSNGTSGGTRLVKDIYAGKTPADWGDPMPYGSYPANLTAFNGKLYFTASGEDGTELWVSDGTAGGTRLAALASNPQNLTVAGGKLYFTATGEDGADALFVTDGTADGTLKLTDLGAPMPGAQARLSILPPWWGASGHELMAVGNTLYFTGRDASGGRELWKTDGTVEGTVRVEDIRPGKAGSQVGLLGEFKGRLLFAANNGRSGRELWISDGSALGTRRVKDLNTGGAGSSPQILGSVNGKTFFLADNGQHGLELWVTDGTAAGTRLVRDINRTYGPTWGVGGDDVPAGSDIHSAVVLGSYLYFVANDGVHGDELWRSDGSASGTRMVKDINRSNGPWMGGSGIYGLTGLGDKLYFGADDGSHGRELWVSDGTSRGTRMVTDINEQPQTGFDGPFFPLIDGGVDMPKGNDVSILPWPMPIPLPVPLPTPIEDGTQSADVGEIVVLGDKLIFSANNGLRGQELWISDGTEDGTHLLKDLAPGRIDVGDGSTFPRNSYPSQFVRAGSKVFFTADNGTSGVELWVTDGTAAGTRLLKDINTTPPAEGSEYAAGSYPINLTAVGNTVYFTADDGVHGPALWRSNGTRDGTLLVKSFDTGGVPFQGSIGQFVALNNTLFFVVDDGVNGMELWKSSGSPGTTRMVKDIFPGVLTDSSGNTFGNSGGPLALTAAGGKLYFTADDGSHGRELWVTDGTSRGTALVQDVNPGPGSGADWSTTMHVVNDTLYFTATDGVHGQELWTLPLAPVAVV